MGRPALPDAGAVPSLISPVAPSSPPPVARRASAPGPDWPSEVPMRTRLVRWFLPAALLLGLAPGCMTLTRERPLPVQVIDAETKRPIHGVTVQLDYAVPPPAWASLG